MEKFNNLKYALLMLVALISIGVEPVYAATAPTLGEAGSFSVLGHTTVANTGATTMPGDLGISIGGAPTGFPPGTVGPPGTIRNAGSSLAAQNAATAAFDFIDQPCTTTYAGTQDLVGLSLVPGVYCADAFRLTGDLTLDGGTNDVWIFKSASDLITSTGDGVARVIGGNPCNVWWRVVSSATIGPDSVFVGNILASASISLQTRASLSGRALAQTGQVSLDTNTITGAQCLTSATVTGVTSATVLPSTGSGSNMIYALVALLLSGAIVPLILIKRKG